MNLEELSNTLPNGFHDTELKSIFFDLQAKRAQLSLDIWVASADASTRDNIEKYRPATLSLDGLEFWIANPQYPQWVADQATIDTNPFSKDRHDDIEIPPVSANAFIGEIYSRTWNSFVVFAAKSATLEWNGAVFSNA